MPYITLSGLDPRHVKDPGIGCDGQDEIGADMGGVVKHVYSAYDIPGLTLFLLSHLT